MALEGAVFQPARKPQVPELRGRQVQPAPPHAGSHRLLDLARERRGQGGVAPRRLWEERL